MIDFSPLRQTLENKGLLPVDLMRRCELHPSTMSKITKNKSVNLTTIAKICVFLRVPIEKVVRIDFED